jgi:hypothetical protein
MAPLPEDLRTVLGKDNLVDMWKQAVEVEPRLVTDFYDIRGGTLGIEKDWQVRRHEAQSTE